MPCEYGMSIIITRHVLHRTKLNVVWTLVHSYVTVVGWSIPVNILLSLSCHLLEHNIFKGLKGSRNTRNWHSVCCILRVTTGVYSR